MAPSVVAVLDSSEQLAAITHPTRLRVLDALRAPDSAAGVARQLGEPRQRINHHVRELAKAGLLVEAGERRKGNFVEQLYESAAGTFVAVAPPHVGRRRATASHRRPGLAAAPRRRRRAAAARRGDAARPGRVRRRGDPGGGRRGHRSLRRRGGPGRVPRRVPRAHRPPDRAARRARGRGVHRRARRPPQHRGAPHERHPHRDDLRGRRRPRPRPGRRSRSSGPAPPNRASGGSRASSAAAPRSTSSTSSGSPSARSTSRAPTRSSPSPSSTRHRRSHPSRAVGVRRGVRRHGRRQLLDPRRAHLRRPPPVLRDRGDRPARVAAVGAARRRRRWSSRSASG